MPSHAAETVDVLREISSTLSSVKLSLDRTNERLGSIERHHSNLAADFALVMADRNITGMLEKETSGKLQVRHFERTTPVTERLLGTTELLELILLELPMRDLLLAQRVSKRFKQVIDTTPAIQRALFFEPEASGSMAEDCKPRINPLLEAGSKLLVFNDNRKGFVVDIEGDVLYLHSPSRHWIAILTPRLVVPSHESSARAHFADGSWRRMFVTQPPCPLKVYNSSFSRTSTQTQPRRLGEVWHEECYQDQEACPCFRDFVGGKHAPPRLAKE